MLPQLVAACPGVHADFRTVRNPFGTPDYWFANALAANLHAALWQVPGVGVWTQCLLGVGMANAWHEDAQAEAPAAGDVAEFA